MLFLCKSVTLRNYTNSWKILLRMCPTFFSFTVNSKETIFSGKPKSYWIGFYINIKDVFICKNVCDTVKLGSLGTFKVASEALSQITKMLASRRDFYCATKVTTEIHFLNGLWVMTHQIYIFMKVFWSNQAIFVLWYNSCVHWHALTVGFGDCDSSLLSFLLSRWCYLSSKEKFKLALYHSVWHFDIFSWVVTNKEIIQEKQNPGCCLVNSMCLEMQSEDCPWFLYCAPLCDTLAYCSCTTAAPFTAHTEQQLQ